MKMTARASLLPEKLSPRGWRRNDTSC